MLNKTDLYFLTIAKTGNLNKAAMQLYVSQPSLSKYIQRLEARLGTPLFDHSVSPMQLNESGKLYLRYLLDAVEKEQELLTQIDEINQMIRGTLRLGIPSYCGQCYLPKILPKYQEEMPQVSVELHEDTGDKLEQALVNQEIDLAILHLPILNEHLTYEPVANERILLVTQRSLEDKGIFGERGITVREGKISDFDGKALIMPQTDQKLGQIVNDFFCRIGYSPSIFTRTRNVATTLALAAVGMGAGFVPESGLDTISEEILKKLSFYSFEHELSAWQLAAVRRKNSVSSIFSQRFVELFKAC